jgi:hypothetical protein
MAFGASLYAGQWISLEPAGNSSPRGLPLSPERVQKPRLQVTPLRVKGTRKSVEITYDVFALLKDTVTKGEAAYNRLFISGCAPSPEPGKPEMPVKTVFIEIPKNYGFTISVKRGKQLTLQDITVVPAQERPMDFKGLPNLPEPAFVIDTDTYRTDSFFPDKNLLSSRVIRLRGHDLLALRFAPLQFNPVTKTLLATSSLQITVELAPEGKAKKAAPGMLSHTAFDAVHRGGLFSFAADSAGAGEPSRSHRPEKYMVLLNDRFSDNATLKEFMAWKRRKGYDVVPVKTSEIPAAKPGAPSDKEIVSFMRALAPENYPAYLLIIGDQKQDTGVQGYFFSTKFGGYSDLYFACRDSQDYLPDLFYGRLPASSPEELDLMLEKVLAMDRHPPADGMYNKILVSGQIQDGTAKEKPDQVADRLFCETADAVACYFESHPGYACTRAMVNPGNMPATGQWNAEGLLWSGEPIGERVSRTFIPSKEAVSRVTRAISNGVALVQHRDHGFELGWGDPLWFLPHLAQLANGELRPLVFSINCLTGRYNNENQYRAPYDAYNGKTFAKSLLLHPNGGAYGVIAAVDVSFSWYNDYLVHGFYSAFFQDYLSYHNTSETPNWSKDLSAPLLFQAGKAKRLGEILNSGKLYLYDHLEGEQVEQTFLLFHLFGDPEAFLQWQRPEAQHPSFPAQIAAQPGQRSVSVGNLAPGTLVCLYAEEKAAGDGLKIHQAQVASGADATFFITADRPGTILVTATRYGTRPFEGAIRVTGADLKSPPQPFDMRRPPEKPREKPRNDGWQDVIGAAPM